MAMTHKDNGDQRIHVWMNQGFMSKLNAMTAAGGELEGLSKSKAICALAERGMERSNTVIDCINERMGLLNDFNQIRADALHDCIEKNSASLYEEIVGQRRIAELGVSNLANQFHDFVWYCKAFAIVFGVLLGFCVISLAFILSHVYGI